MSTAQTNAASAANVNGASAMPKIEDQAQGPAAVSKGDPSPVNWDSEIQLVSSLAKLQEVERKVSGNFGQQTLGKTVKFYLETPYPGYLFLIHKE